MSILDGLNKEQIEAVTTTEGYVRVVAGAGTGKTKALTSRYAYLVDEVGVSPKRILSVTFTNKAANEMKERIQGTLGDIGTPYIMTFHSFCNRVLREEIGVLNYPTKFKIMDTNDQKQLLRGVYKELGLTNSDLSLDKCISKVLCEGCKTGVRNIVQDYERILSTSSVNQINIMTQFFDDRDYQLVMTYLKEQKRSFLLDFEDLINFVIYIFKTNPEIKERWQNAFDYVQVDEFQDVDNRQFELISILSEKNNNLFVVGDDAQVLYSWRGANVNNIVHFEEVLKEIRGNNKEIESKTVILNQNYRSTPEILNVSNSLIKHNETRIDKDLVTENIQGARVLHYHGKTVYKEADWVARRIKSLNRSFSDIAILYRSNAVSRVIEEKLISEEIPYEILSGLSFYQRAEIKDVLAILSLVAFGDNVSFVRVVTNNSLGVGKKKQEELKTIADEKETTMFEILKEQYNDKKVKGAKGKILVPLIDELRVETQREERKICHLIDRIIEAFEYEEKYSDEEDVERYTNILELREAAKRFEHQAGEKVEIADYLGALSLYSETDKEESKDKVKLMTVHAAKGLEYPVVFVVGMNEGIMPSGRTVTKADMEEERRIAYVAMTRAKELLFLTDAEGDNYDSSMRLPSRFIFNIERDMYDREGKMDDYLVKMALSTIKQSEEMMGIETKVPDTRIKVGDRVSHAIFKQGLAINEDSDIIYVIFDSGQLKGFSKDTDKLKKIV